MTTDLTKHASASDVDAALKILREAAGVAHDRGMSLNVQGLTKWPSDAQKIVVRVEEAGRLFADEQHGKTLHQLAQKLTREGRRAGVVLEIQW